MNTPTGKVIDTKRLLMVGTVIVVLLGGVAYGVNHVWQGWFGVSQASAEDCRLAQQVFDRAKTPPTDPAQVQAWQLELQQIALEKFDDLSLGVQVFLYVKWSAAKATGTAAAMPTPDAHQEMLHDVQAHCVDSGVKLQITPLL